MKPMLEPWKTLCEKALQAREQAYAPYSHFKVGCALKLSNGTILTGCNIENATYGATLCAERLAIGKAISEYQDFKITHMFIIADSKQPCAPCGICRQTILEFGDSIEITFSNLDFEVQYSNIKELLPYAFYF